MFFGGPLFEHLPIATDLEEPECWFAAGGFGMSSRISRRGGNVEDVASSQPSTAALCGYRLLLHVLLGTGLVALFFAYLLLGVLVASLARD